MNKVANNYILSLFGQHVETLHVNTNTAISMCQTPEQVIPLCLLLQEVTKETVATMLRALRKI